MAKKPGITLGPNHLASQERGKKFANSGGFDRDDSRLGKDTIPGPAVGAPLMQTTVVDDYDVKRTRYADGINPYGLNADVSPNPKDPTMQRPLTGKAPASDSPVPGRAQRPDPQVTTKSVEVARADASIGSEPRDGGVLKRD